MAASLASVRTSCIGIERGRSILITTISESSPLFELATAFSSTAEFGTMMTLSSSVRSQVTLRSSRFTSP